MITLATILIFQGPQEDSFLVDNFYAVPEAIHEHSIRDETIDVITNAEDVAGVWDNRKWQQERQAKAGRQEGLPVYNEGISCV